jgi:AAA+ ATPase superfamily predicted ATPase
MRKKPARVFDREWEWGTLTQFVGDRRRRPSLGIVCGRRRQGKSLLLEALTTVHRGFYYEAIDGSLADILADLGAKLAVHTGAPAPFALTSLEHALSSLLRLGAGPKPVTVVLDEFPAMAAANPSAPSILRNLLGPGGAEAGDARTRLLLCGSAIGFMGRLLAGQSPLRGRAELELIVSAFDFRTARRFWGLRDLALAAKVFAVVGGTPAYRREFVGDDTPRGPKDFDAWVARTVLNPAVPLFRETRYLLAEDPAIGDLALYQSVLASIAAGETTSARIAARLGRAATSLAHPLNVLVDAGFLSAEEDAFHAKRVHYTINEPLIRFHHAILRPSWSELERPGRAAQVWRRTAPQFHAQVLGPAFESICRTWAARFASERTFGGLPHVVRRGLVPDAAARTTHEVDVVVMGEDDRIAAVGEAKWGAVDARDLERLQRIASLLAARGRDTRDTRLALFSARGFSEDLRRRAEADRGRVILVDLDRLYEGD